MKPPFNPDDIVASRQFDRDDGLVCLRIHRPVAWPSDTTDREPDWVCWYSILFPNGELKKRSSAGIDSVQALLLAFAGAMSDLLYVGNGTPERRLPLTWLAGDDLGLTINHFE